MLGWDEWDDTFDFGTPSEQAARNAAYNAACNAADAAWEGTFDALSAWEEENFYQGNFGAYDAQKEAADFARQHIMYLYGF